MYGIDPEILEKLNPVTVMIFKRIKVNKSTNITQTVINKVAYNALNISNYRNSEENTKFANLLNLKKITYVFGLLKRELEKDISSSARVSFTAKLISLLFKINDMVIKYNIKYGELQKLFDEADDALIIAEITKNKFVGIAKTQTNLNALMKSIIVNNNTERDENIRDSVNLEIFLKLRVIRYVCDNYKDNVNPQTQADTYKLLNNLLEIATNFINKMIENIPLISFYVSSDKIVQGVIRNSINKKYIQTIFDTEQ